MTRDTVAFLECLEMTASAHVQHAHLTVQHAHLTVRFSHSVTHVICQTKNDRSVKQNNRSVKRNNRSLQLAVQQLGRRTCCKNVQLYVVEVNSAARTIVASLASRMSAKSRYVILQDVALVACS